MPDGALTYFVNFPSDLVLGPDSFTATLSLHRPPGATGPVSLEVVDVTGYHVTGACVHVTGACTTMLVSTPY